MSSAFLEDTYGPYIEVDPDSDLDYSLTCWIEGVVFTAIAWELSPDIIGAVYNSQINNSPVVIDGISYDTGKVATAFVKTLVPGVTYILTLHATFTAGRKDDRSIRLICKER